MSGQLVVVVLKEAQEHFGVITRENEAEVTRWVRARIQARRGESPAAVVPMPTTPSGWSSWYEREPGQEG